jgi:hypothetical protein
MSNQYYTKKRNFGKIFLTIIVLFVIFALALLFTGCSTPASSTPDPKASSASTPVEEEPVVETPTNPAFGETVSFPDGISLSVSAPAEFVPSELAAGAVEGQPSVVFEFVITNNSEENFDPTIVYATASSGGVEAPGIFDTSENVGFPPTTAILPGQTIKWNQAFSTADPAAITLEVSVGFEYDDVIFTNIK